MEKMPDGAMRVARMQENKQGLAMKQMELEITKLNSMLDMTRQQVNDQAQQHQT